MGHLWLAQKGEEGRQTSVGARGSAGHSCPLPDCYLAKHAFSWGEKNPGMDHQPLNLHGPVDRALFPQVSSDSLHVACTCTLILSNQGETKMGAGDRTQPSRELPRGC